MEADLVERAGVPFEAIPAAGVHGVGWRKTPGNLWQLWRGYRQARQLLGRFRPDVLFFTGGYVAVPVALAARASSARRLPIALFVPDIEPGLALKTLARFADRIAVSVEDSRAYFGRRHVTVTGYPARAELAAWDRQAALRTLDLRADLPVLLVLGGSSGARSLNRALLAGLPTLLAEMQIVHVSGRLDWPEVEAARATLAPELAARYRPYPYLHAELGAAFTVAGLALSRAGASTLGELPLFGLPAVLVPYPYAWRYQKVNAGFLARHGAAQVVDDQDLLTQLIPVVQGLMRDPARRESMRQAMHSLCRAGAAGSIAGLLHNLADDRQAGKGLTRD